MTRQEIMNGKKTVRDEDFELVQAINNGRTDLFQQLVEKYQQKIYNFGMRMCGESRDAEDLVQETFLTIFRYLKGFRYETRFKNWMYRVATTTCLKAKRKPKYKVRAYTRCQRCGRPHSVYRKFGLCRVCLREMAHAGELPGITKSSW